MKNRKPTKAGTFQVIENWELISIRRSTGEVMDKRVICNAIVNDGLERMADLLINNSTPAYFRALAVGTGTTAVTNSDTALQTEFQRETATLSKDSVYVAKFYKEFDFASGTDEDITEAGIFDSATASGSTMLARNVFSAIAVDADTNLKVTATITVARV